MELARILYYLGKDGNGAWRSGMSRGGSGGGNVKVVTYTSSIKTVMYLFLFLSF